MKQYTINDGLASNHVYMCDQDSKGYLWVATTSGLCRFDGKKFKTYDFESGLLDNEVLCVLCDGQNNIWLNTFSANPSLARIHNDTVETFRNSALFSSMSSPNAYINIDGGLYSRRKESVYFKGRDHLTCIIRDRKPVAKKLDMLLNYPFETENGQVFVSDTGNLYELVDTNISLFQKIKRRRGEPFKMTHYYKGILYALSEHAIDLYHNTRDGFVFFNTINFTGNVNMLHCDQYGVWLAFTNQKGALLYKDYTFHSTPRKVAVPGIVNFFTTDREGGVWVSTIDNGLFFLPRPEMISYSISDGLSSAMVSAIEPMSPTQCWLGFNTGKAQLVSLKGNELEIGKTITLLDDSLNNNFVAGIVKEKDGTIYFLNRGGLIALEQGRLKNLILKGGAKSLALLNDTLLGMGISGGYRIYNTRSGKSNLFRVGRTYAQAIDGEKTLWLGGIRGLFRLPFIPDLAGHTDSVPIPDLQNIKVNKLAVKNAYLWAGTQNQGLYLLKGDSVIAWFTKDNLPLLPSNTIKALAVKDNGIWVGTNRGILYGRFDYNTVRFTKAFKMDHHDGLLSPDVNEIRIEADNVFIATYNGFTVLQTIPHSKLYYTIADIAVTELPAGTKYKNENVTFPYNEKGFEITFNAVSFRYNSEIEYRYQLAPFDKEWKTTQNNLVQYTNIPPGTYRFRVVAFDNRGNQSLQPYSISITIRPRYWQTWLFYLFVALCIILLILSVFYFFYRYQKRRTQERILQGRLIARSKLHVLRAQLKPHFIFNSLNAIKDFIYSNKNDDAAELLQGFAGLIRKGIHLADKDFISIREEVAFLTGYLQLEQKKCDDCFGYTISVADDLYEILIPALITQPFIENAVIHGVKNKQRAKGYIEIDYSAKEKDIVCTISDNGIGIIRSAELKKHFEKSSRGLSISQDRINYFKAAFEIEITLSIRDKSELNPDSFGTVVTVTIINGIQQLQRET